MWNPNDKSTSITPGYRFSSRKSLSISMEEYHPVNGVAGNCNPPISVKSEETPGSGYHCNPRPFMAGKLKTTLVQLLFSTNQWAKAK